MVEQSKEKSPQEIQEEAIVFMADLSFRNPNVSLFSLSLPKNSQFVDLRKDLKPEGVFKKLSFYEIEYVNLPSELKGGLENDRNLLGHPLSKGKSGRINPNTKIFRNKKGDVFYFIEDNGDETYSWSRVQESDQGYKVQEINKDNNIGGILKRFAFNEIMHSQAPHFFPYLTKNDKPSRLIADAHITAAKETRDATDEIIGLA